MSEMEKKVSEIDRLKQHRLLKLQDTMRKFKDKEHMEYINKSKKGRLDKMLKVLMVQVKEGNVSSESNIEKDICSFFQKRQKSQSRITKSKPALPDFTPSQIEDFKPCFPENKLLPDSTKASSS